MLQFVPGEGWRGVWAQLFSPWSRDALNFLREWLQ